ncbi:TPA: restriction endonuclease subunit S [Listeria innocua]|uniref:restriction endonuclease subunit S n=1 Tax=Listeria innocua TaxID=1642 RepID=UPI001888CEF3|nr:restriction endonuclease subunit S [Listeria innocua]MBF2409428.1 restriction endonuclease subunit S [Listeria innocua]MDH4683383.1 restriction endonuclease subunit S [Listeria innocua]HBM4052750.1 restriction endonuclease subunit S [Listeria innocua]HCE1189055.1 restriction endonuclease subunit S [Listeria innocua]
MKKLEKSVPVIRFKGFSEAWEQRKLGDHAKYRRGSFPQPYGNKEWYDGEGAMPFVQVVDVTSKLTLVENTKQKISKLAQPKSVFVPKGKVIVTLQGSIGRIAITQYDSFVDRTLLIFDDYEKETDERFWAYTIQKKFEIEKLKAPGGTIKTITKEALSSFDVHLPQFEEQQKIGILFKQLDDTIALHQRKLEALKLMKKGLLQQMFPKRGENIPKIRLDDFDDIWEQRILGECLKESKIKGSNGSLAKKLTVKLWRKGVVPKVEIYTGSSATQYYIRKTGQFMYGKLDFLNQAFGIVPLELDGYESTLDSPAFDIEESINETFLLEYVSLGRFYKYQGNIANGSRRAKRIHTDTFFEMPIPLPNSNEQQKIGTFSQQIDDLIALQQNKLEKLSSLKRIYLKNMFI